MAENSKIEWCDHTFNPWEGCTKVSAGCKHCYAEARANRFGTVKWGPTGQRRRTSAANWRKPLAWNRQAKAEGRRYRVFCASLADVFEDKPDQPELEEWRWDLMELISKTPHLDWLLLTKRPENAADFFNALYQDEDSWVNSIHVSIDFGEWMLAEHCYGINNPIPNIWIGTSVENQEQADKRIPELLSIPAAVRFLSMEPLLGEVNLHISGTISEGLSMAGHIISRKIVDWVIVGGESGHNARPMHPDWARSIRDQCKEAGVPFFFKQWGEYSTNQPDENKPFDVRLQPDNRTPIQRVKEDGISSRHSVVNMWKVGKSKAGRLLDGREWNEFPTTEVAQ